MERTSVLLEVELKRRTKIRMAELGMNSLSLLIRQLLEKWLDGEIPLTKEQNGPQ